MPNTEQVIVMASIPVIKILIMCGIGYVITSPLINAFPTDARKHMNKLVFLIFMPSLIFTRLVQAVTSKKMIDWWFMPLNVFLSFAIGATIGLLVVKYTKPSPHLESLTIACCSAGNTGNIPLVLIPSICEEDNNPFSTDLQCSINGVAYVSYGMWMATLLVWTFIYNLLMPIKENTKPMVIEESSKRDNKDNNVHEGNYNQDKTYIENDNYVYKNNKVINTMASSSKIEVNDHINENMSLLQVPTIKNGHEAIISRPQNLLSILDSIKSVCTKDLAKSYAQQIFTPPTTSAILALIIGGCVYLKSIFIGPHAPLRFVIESLAILGDATIPCMNLILGGNLVSGLNGPNIKYETIVGIITTRFLILPIIGCGIVKSVSRLRFIPSDPLFQFVLLLQFCMPTAINVGTIAQLHGNGEMEVSKILFWSYIFSAIFLTLWIIVFLSTI